MLRLAFLLLAGMSLNTWADSLVKHSVCVYDPLGANGSLFSLMKDYKLKALDWGMDFQLNAYTDEKIAIDDFKAQQCDMVLMTGARARPFNKFAASIEAIGAVPNHSIMKKAILAISSPKASKLMTEGRYEVAGVMPAGSIYMFLRDRSVKSVEDLSGKRIATFEYDQPSIKMVNYVGASVVPSNSANFSGKFNNGSVDIAYAPAVAYKPLELYKGLGDKGAVTRFNLAYLDFQMVIYKDKFPADFGQKSRAFVASQFDRMVELIDQDTAAIDEKYWVDLTPEDTARYNEMLRKVRIILRDEGTYDGKMLRLLRRLRCAENPSAAECVEKLE